MRRRQAIAIAIAAAVLAAWPASARAQVFRLQAGSSTLYQAHGGSIFVKADQYEAMLGIGDLDPFRVGASVRTRYRSADLGFGDAIVPFRLPTDVFAAGHSFLGRGVSVGYEADGVRLFTMGGTTSTGYWSPYTFGARPEEPVGLCFLEGVVSPKLKVASRSLYSGDMTTILGFDWTPRGDLEAAIAGGVGSGDGYGAASAVFERSWITARAAYVIAGDDFQRVVVPQPQASEVDRENIEISLRPTPRFAVSVARNNYLQPASPGVANVRGTVNQAIVSGVVERASLSAAVFLSESPGGGGRGLSFSAGRDVTRFLKLNGSVLRSDPEHGPSSTMLVGNVRESVSPRLDLVQVVTHSAGNTTVSFGGNFLSNRFKVGVEYQTIYVPFASEDPFRQALNFHLTLRAPGDFQANVGSYIGPDGRVRYTAYGSQYLYRGESGGGTKEVGLLPNVVLGVVCDEGGNPVSGAAVRIDKEIAYTDSRGTFFVRMKKARAYEVEVQLEEFLAPGRYEVVEAPERAHAAPDAEAEEILIVVRRVGSGAGTAPGAPSEPGTKPGAAPDSEPTPDVEKAKGTEPTP